MLARSGVVYSVGTLEFKFLVLHTWAQAAHKYINEIFNAKLLTDSVSIAFMHATRGKDRSNYTGTLSSNLKKFIDNNDPFGKREKDSAGLDSAHSKKATSEDKVKFINALAKSGTFSSMSDVVNATAALSKAIVENSNK